MKWYINSVCSKKECIEQLYEVINLIAGNALAIDKKNVILPDDLDLLSKIKYTEEPGESKLTIKLQWHNDIPYNGEKDVPEDVTSP